MCVETKSIFVIGNLGRLNFSDKDQFDVILKMAVVRIQLKFSNCFNLIPDLLIFMV